MPDEQIHTVATMSNIYKIIAADDDDFDWLEVE